MAGSLQVWDATAREAMSVGETVALQPAADPPLESSVFITKLDSALYAVVAEARMTTADAYALRRRVGIMVCTVLNGARVSPPERVAEQAWSELY